METVGGAVVVGGVVPAPVPVGDMVGGTDESVGASTNVAEEAVCANESEENARTKSAAMSMRKERSDGMFATSVLRCERAKRRADAKKMGRQAGKVTGNMGRLTLKHVVELLRIMHGLSWFPMNLISAKMSCKPQPGCYRANALSIPGSNV